MNADQLLAALKKKLKVETDKELAEFLGVTPNTLCNWSGTMFTPNKVATLVAKSRKAALKDAIWPIIEYYPITSSRENRNRQWEFLSKDNARHTKIREELKTGSGIYVFYSSLCRPIYTGKAVKQDLYSEMKSAYNRERDPQTIWTVEHPKTGTGFTPAYKKERRVLRRKVFLHEVAVFISAYFVEEDLIDNLEALMIRMFANTVTNKAMPTIRTSQRR